MRSPILAVLGAAVVVAGMSAPAATARHHSHGSGGDLLISDQFNNRAIEVNPATRAIVWSFGSGNPSLCNPGPKTIIGLNDAERVSDGITLLSGTGIPAGASPLMPSGCVDNRVIAVSHSGRIAWQYGQAGVTGSGQNQLNVPVFAIQLPNRNILITDQGNNRIIEVGRFRKRIVWSYGPTSGPGQLSNPNSAELLPDGHVLIADENNNRVIEVTRSGHIVWKCCNGSTSVGRIKGAAFASRLPNGDTLITDAGNGRIIEVTPAKQLKFQYFTNTEPDSNAAPAPTNAVRLRSGKIVIADQFNDRALIIDRLGHTIAQWGKTNVPGTGSKLLDAPYTAFITGDFTGQTPPPRDF